MSHPSSPPSPAPSDALTPDEYPDWRQIRLRAAFLVLLTPCLVLSAFSGALFLALEGSTPATFDRIHFFFYFFDVGREINVPTWYSSMMWIAVAVLAGYFARKSGRYSFSWWLFAAVGVLFSVDEMLELHERLDVVGAELAAFLPFQLGFVWVIPGVLISLGIVAVLLRLILSLPRGVRLGLILAGATFVSGAIGVETLSGLVLAESGLVPAFFGLTLLEETFEMTGICLCIASLLHLIEYKAADGGTTYRLAGSARPATMAR